MGKEKWNESGRWNRVELKRSARDGHAIGELKYDGIRTAEMNHDPFFPLVLAAEHSQRLELATSIAVAFARSPMNLANLGHDLNAYSQGRFTLGWALRLSLTSRKRFSMQWGAPAAQMRE